MADPIQLPSGILFLTSEMRTTAVKNTARMEGRHLESVQSGFPYWMASFASARLDLSQLGRASTWLMKAKSAGTLFLAHEIVRPRPYMENMGVPLSGTKALGGVFDGTANLVAITNSREVIIDELPAGFQLVEGDYVEFTMSNSVRSLHVIDEDVTADGSGQAILKFFDGLDEDHFTIAADVQFETPSCVMQVIGDPYLSKADGERRLVFQAQEAPQQ